MIDFSNYQRIPEVWPRTEYCSVCFGRSGRKVIAIHMVKIQPDKTDPRSRMDYFCNDCMVETLILELARREKEK
jgi:hypothetical protein